jgi:hypothetical protein
MATYRFGVVRARIAASQLVAGARKRFEYARRLSILFRFAGKTRGTSETIVTVPGSFDTMLTTPRSA